MSDRINALAQLLGKSSVEECTLEELQQLTTQYPYFAPAQFLLLQKLKADSAADFELQRQKAVLYYNDPLLFDYLVSPEKFLTDENVFTEKKFAGTSPANVSGVDTVDETENDSIDEQSLTPEEAVTEETEVNLLHETPQPDEAASAFTVEPAVGENETGENKNVDVPVGLPEETVIVQAQENEKSEETFKVVGEEPAEETFENGEAAWSPETPATESQKAEEPGPVPVTEAVQTGPKPPVEAITNSIPEKTIITAEAVLSFEPYYTVDYFAAQGIKPTADELSKDKLGRQLRSFTDWLKIMKRLPASEISKAPESTAEKTVESMASHSVADSDVITEAMAEVWTKQGHPEKAIETYNKLSLLIPSKKAYFAAKIENLKQS